MLCPPFYVPIFNKFLPPCRRSRRSWKGRRAPECAEDLEDIPTSEGLPKAGPGRGSLWE